MKSRLGRGVGGPATTDEPQNTMQSEPKNEPPNELKHRIVAASAAMKRVQATMTPTIRSRRERAQMVKPGAFGSTLRIVSILPARRSAFAARAEFRRIYLGVIPGWLSVAKVTRRQWKKGTNGFFHGQ